MPTAHEHFSEQFQKWEMRGRGWQVFDRPVVPEPPFVPFLFRAMSDSLAEDDGRRHTFMSSLVQNVSRILSTAPSPPPLEPEEEEPEPVDLVREPLVEFHASLTTNLKVASESFEHFFRNLALCREPLAFELLGTHKRVLTQFAASAEDAASVRRQLQAHFTDVQFQQQADTLALAWQGSEGDHAFAVEFGLEQEFMLPLASGKLDPFIGIVGALSELQPGELGLFQVLFQPVQHDWAESITRAVTHADGKPFYVNMPELASAAKNKIASPLYAAVVRILVRTDSHERTAQIARDLAGSLRVFIHPLGNALVPLDNDDYPFEEHVTDVIYRQSRRSGMLLNTDELIGFVHLPSSAVRSPVLQRELGKTKAAPLKVQNSTGLLLGQNTHMGQTVPVRLTPNQRVRHTHIIGGSGKGKSTLLFNLIRQDIESGAGVGVLDPHGDLVNQILGIIPPDRIKDVVLVDPSDSQFSVGFNILTAHSDTEKTLLASDLVSVFRRLSTSWGDQMNSVLNNAILVFLESERGGTIFDLRRFLIEPAFHAEFLKTVHDSELNYYWKKSFPHLTGDKSKGPILTRLEAFLAPKPIRYMVSQPKNLLDFGHIMDTGKIFLAKLPEGIIGRENSFLLGSLLVAKFQQLAMARQEQDEAARRDFWLYIDEFPNFITPSMAQILRGTRKYRLGLTLAHQEMRQLERDADVASAIMANPETRIYFGVGDDDARKLAQGLSFFEAKDLQNLEPGQAICRIEKANQDFNLTIPNSDPIPADQARATREAVIAESRRKYSRSRSEIEAMLQANLGIVNPQVETKPSPVPTRAEPPKISEVPNRPAGISPESAPASSDTDTTESLHTAIKDKIGAEAETLDYSVTFEENFPAIQARSDIVLRRGSKTIAAQVTVTTPVIYEVESVRKLLKASFAHIAVISSNRKKMNLIQQTLAGSGDLTERIGFYSPEQFMSQLSDWALNDPEGGKAEKNNPHRNLSLNLLSGALTEAERKQNEKMMLDALKQKLKR